MTFHRQILPLPIIRAALSAALLLVGTSVSPAADGFPRPTGVATAFRFPYSMIGQVDSDTGFGTGTVITPSGVVTAAHVLYDEDEGWSTGVTFYRGQYGNTYLQRGFPDALHVLSGYIARAEFYGGDSSLAFAYDLGGLFFEIPPGNGSAAGIRANVRTLTGPTPNRGFGYGAEFHSGDDLLFVDARTVFRRRLGAYLLNSSFYVESGMSGGPVFARIRGRGNFVVAVMVSSSPYYQGFSSGVRAFDATATQFFAANLH